MTRMLASVADAAEAEVVLQFGADIIDLKDAARGALGPVALGDAREAISAVSRRRETSATMGDPPYRGETLLARSRALAAMGVNYVKLAVDGSTVQELSEQLRPLMSEVAFIGLIFADEGPDFALVPTLAALGFKGAMLDTKDKARGRLLTHLDVARLEEFCSQARALGLTSGLAGSLEAPDIPRLLLARPEVLGFRASLCHRHDRAGSIDPAAVALIRDLIPREKPDADGSPKIDWRLLARGIIGGRDADGEVDRVYVRDFVVLAEIGAYNYERGERQRVAFDVEALVRRVGPHIDDMRSIFSYDVILDAIRLVVGRGHIDFVETLAEDVASIVLRHARVRSVRISVRKLDVITGAVGIEITRERVAGSADARPLSIVANPTRPRD